jgi:hypothetical protein
MNLEPEKLSELSEKILPLMQEAIAAQRCHYELARQIRKIADPDTNDEERLRRTRTEGLDRWQKFKSNGNRICSFCGSLHPDDMFELVRQCIDAPEDAEFNSVVEIEQSDKPYKIYIRQPGVRNAMEGGIKFYTHHLPRDEKGNVTIDGKRNDEYAKAVRMSKKRFDRYLTTI